MINVLLFGQVPPPYHGQSVMIKSLVDNLESENIKIFFVRMEYSKTIDHVGKFDLQKIRALFSLLGKATSVLINNHIDYIYYPPTGFGKIPFYRDIITLLYLKLFGKKIVFHFHGMGLDENFSQSNTLVKYLAKKAYFKPYVNIYLSHYNEKYLNFLQPVYSKIVPYGIEDVSLKFNGKRKNTTKKRVLYLGNLIRSKGIFDFIEAIKVLHQKKMDVEGVIIGGIPDKETENELKNRGLFDSDFIHYLGIKTGDEKWMELARADAFCFPTYYETENLPVVIIEAMQFSLPIISTNWRSIPSMVTDNYNGYIVLAKAPLSIAEKIIAIFKNEETYQQLANNSRKRYLDSFQRETYISRIREVFFLSKMK